ncbi:MAG TPA: GNAT family N-acetyltransferase [Acidimicrobiales bacterium]|nr:GNAT family N-acetyltransferase [Acidimicrobiales bacterium]
MPTVRPATTDDVPLLARIMAEGFYADPVMTWALPDDATRLGKLTRMFTGLAQDSLPPRGHVYLADAAAISLWRDPTFDHEAEAAAAAEREAAEQEAAEQGDEEPLFTADEAARFDNLTSAMRDVHPHEPHWYLNVLSTLPSHQSQGLGAAAIQPVLALADAAGMPCYLESTNPRNRTLYRREGFDDLRPVPFDGPDMLAMWRPART